jgi:proton-translocating NADH-quinone oxidoreductase chain N
MNTPYFIWTIALLLAGCPVVYLVGRLGLRRGWRVAAPLLAVLMMVAAWIPLGLAAGTLVAGKVANFAIGALSLQLDGIGLLLAVVALGLGTFAALYSWPYMAAEAGQEKYYAMLLAMVGAVIGLGCASDLFNLWVWFEAMAISSYLLVAFYRDQPASLEAGFKYLVQSSIGSVLVLTGIGLVLAATGTLSLAEIGALTAASPLLVAGGAAFVIGFGVKAALVPMHTWLPDAHAQAPSAISAMLSGVVIETGLVAMLRVILALSGVQFDWAVVLLGFGALNMLVGNLMALRQTQVKRLLAYSSLSHLGYMLLGLGIAFYAHQATGAQGSFFHLLNHGLMKGLAFLSAGALLYVLHIAVGDHGSLTVADLAGASRRYPLVALSLSLAVLGLGGLPPLAGFMSKWQIFVAGIEAHSSLLTWLVVFAALNSVLSLAYYMPLVNAVYRLEPSAAVQHGAKMPVLLGVPLVVLAATIVVLGLWPGLMNWLTAPAGAALLAGLGG